MRVIGRDNNGHRWPLKEGMRCMYCGVLDPRQVDYARGHEPEILMADIEDCGAKDEHKLWIDTLYPMPNYSGSSNNVSER